MASKARDIAISPDKLAREVSHSMDISSSPVATFTSPPASFGGARVPGPSLKQLKPFDTQDIKILLLENVNQTGKDILEGQGYQVEALKTSLPEAELIEKIKCGAIFF